MKFLTRVNRNFLILFALLLAMISVSGYLILHTLIIKSTKEALLSREHFIIKQIASTGEIPNLYPVIEVNKTEDYVNLKPSFSEIVLFNELEKENEVFIEYSDNVKISGNYYTIKLRQSTFENEDLVLILALTLFILFLSAFLITYLISKKLNKTVWADFEHNLHLIEAFDLNHKTGLSLLQSQTDEFERLNKAVSGLTEKLRTDYLALKEFTENAAHEIQTPLAIALLNLEEILQQDLSPDSLKKVVNSINAIKRLSSLNQSLILLTKIENRQFGAEEKLNINDLLKYYLQEFEPMFDSKNIKTELTESGTLFLQINRQLAGIFLSNLLSNSVNHNVQNGKILVVVDGNSLKISNTGPDNDFSNENIFNRFVKGHPKSFGLGLAIVKKICDTHNLDIHYTKSELHYFTLSLKS